MTSNNSYKTPVITQLKTGFTHTAVFFKKKVDYDITEKLHQHIRTPATSCKTFQILYCHKEKKLERTEVNQYITTDMVQE